MKFSQFVAACVSAILLSFLGSPGAAGDLTPNEIRYVEEVASLEKALDFHAVVAGPIMRSLGFGVLAAGIYRIFRKQKYGSDMTAVGAAIFLAPFFTAGIIKKFTGGCDALAASPWFVLLSVPMIFLRGKKGGKP